MRQPLVFAGDLKNAPQPKPLPMGEPFRTLFMVRMPWVSRKPRVRYGARYPGKAWRALLLFSTSVLYRNSTSCP